MGNFLVVVATNEETAKSAALFRQGLAHVERLKRCRPDGIFESERVHAASFARQHGASTPLLHDRASGRWLLAIGSWFHRDGDGSGAELRLLERWSEAGSVRTAQALDGFFTLAFGDARSGEVDVVTDLVGSRHAFVREFEHGVAIASSSLLLASLGAAALDPIGCEEFLRTGIVYEDRTLFQEVRKLAPASVHRFGRRRTNGACFEREHYWQIGQLTPDSLRGDHAVESLGAALTDSVRRIGDRFPRPLCDLTGGYDSRALVAAAMSAGLPFETTVAGSTSDHPDVVIAAGLSGITGRPHQCVAIAPTVDFAQLERALSVTDGEIDLVEYARNVMSVHERTAQRYDVSLNGSFGEVARGYWWELLLPNVGQRAPLPTRKVAAARYAAEPASPELFPAGSAIDLVAHFSKVIARANDGLSAWPNTAQMDHAYLQLRMQRWQGRIATATDQIRRCLSPFMFRRVLETMLQTEPRLRRRSLLVRKMLVRLEPRLAAHPLEHGYPAEPFGWRNAHRFLPVLTSYGRRAWEKGARRLGIRGNSAAAPSTFEPARVQLDRDAAVREHLQPESMLLREWLGVERLRNFLQAARAPQFAFDKQWSRLLSLELALRAAR